MSDGEAGALPDADLLVRLQFGPGLDGAARRRIVRNVRRLLRLQDPPSPGARYETSRKRRRRDDGRRDDPDRDYRWRRRRRDRTCADSESDEGGPDYAPGCPQSVALYSQAAGFDVDPAGGGSGGSDAEVWYAHGTKAVIGLTADAAQALGNPCFNCSMPGHELRDCPLPIDEDAVAANRRAFRERGPPQFSGRLHLAVEDEKRAAEMRERFRPGQPLSQQLREALGLEDESDVPDYIESMYVHGYPPGYLGHEPGQDPLLARPPAERPRPPTPDLRIYHDAHDSVGCADEADSTAGPNNANETEPASETEPLSNANEESGEEGAISDDEEGAIAESELDCDNKDASDPAPVRNVPLVQYTGLDLAVFDFSLPGRPGRPLRAYTPRRPARPDYGPAYPDAQHPGSAHRYLDRDYSDHRRYPTHYLANGDEWGGMLAGYHKIVGRSGPDAAACYGREAAPSPVSRRPTPSRMTGYGGDQHLTPAKPPIPCALGPPGQQPEESQPTAVPSDASEPLSAPERAAPSGPEDLEDGECDMETSE
ncbi:hypothetical protein H4R18_002145 [Coemansia javaensis]|uniref:CCHC-type domain-containing protein n=1 Tax=Coemansia javaensis TaxID=2761396 RepID=A0A9W8LKC6_9FUNG|nr:hypothetical protein H4R18_002145 [Coemansia javaensis]